VIPREHRDAANAFLSLEASYRSHEDLIAVGAYRPGSNRQVDAAIALRPAFQAFLRQAADEHETMESAEAELRRLDAEIRRAREHAAGRGAA
jgi:flagellum-specific ATP synthase